MRSNLRDCIDVHVRRCARLDGNASLDEQFDDRIILQHGGSVADAYGAEHLDCRTDLFRRPAFTGVHGSPEPERSGLGEWLSVVGEAE